MSRIVEQGLAAWHAIAAAPSEAALDALLAEDVVFHSPVVHTPQRGRAITRLYLMAAFQVLASPEKGSDAGSGSSGPDSSGPDSSGSGAPFAGPRPRRFRYVREIAGERDAVLEFMSEIDGITIDGVDMIRFDDTGRIVDFKVMVRPLKAVAAIHAAMGRMLEAMKPVGR